MQNKELRLNLIKGEFTNKLSIQKSTSFNIRGYEVELGISDTGHSISILKNQKRLFSEIFTSQKMEQEDIETIDINQKSFIKRDTCNYLFKVYEIGLDICHQEIEQFKRYNILSYEADRKNSKKATIQFILNEKGKDIILKTLQTYPNENIAVITSSLFELK